MKRRARALRDEPGGPAAEGDPRAGRMAGANPVLAPPAPAAPAAGQAQDAARSAQELARELESLRELEARRAAQLLGLTSQLQMPLSAILGFSELLATHSGSPELVRNLAGEVQRDTTHLRDVLRELFEAIGGPAYRNPRDPAALEQEAASRVELLRELLAGAEQRCADLEQGLRAAQLAQQQLQSYADDFRRTYAESRQRLQQLTALYEVSTAIGMTVDPVEVLGRTTAGLRRLLPSAGVAVYLLDDDQVARRRANSQLPELPELPETMLPGDEQLSACLGAGRPSGTEPAAAVAALVLPLQVGSQGLGMILLRRSNGGAFTDEDRRLAEMVASQTSMALQNARLATTDGLTGLFNRRYFEQMLSLECDRARRSGRPLGLLILDIDHFKRFNDGYGHPAGDEVIRAAASVVKGQLRRTDVVARVGGEEFAAILPENDQQAVAVAAERVRRAVEARPPIVFEGQELPGLRVSVGAAALPGPLADSKLLMHSADDALQQAKRGGRNRSVVAPATPAEPALADHPPRQPGEPAALADPGSETGTLSQTPPGGVQ